MKKEIVVIAVANEGEKSFDLDDVQKWEPSDKHFSKDIVYFKNDSIYYSMKRLDFDRIFNQK